MRLVSPFLYLVILLLVSACGKRPIATGPSVAAGLEDLLEVKDFRFSSLQMSGRMELSSPKNNLKVGVSLRMVKDSLIWCSFTGPLNIEGARVLITPDSVKLINRLDRSYTYGALGSIEKLLGTELEFRTLQESLVGNMPYDYVPLRDSLSFDTAEVYIFQERAGFELRSTLDRTTGKLIKIRALSPNKKLVAINSLSNFKALTEKDLLPSFHRIILSESSGSSPSTKVEIDFSRFELDPESLSVPFSVPDSYSKQAL